jgi:hypothetical protein
MLHAQTVDRRTANRKSIGQFRMGRAKRAYETKEVMQSPFLSRSKLPSDHGRKVQCAVVICDDANIANCSAW